jgi:molecular chaperone GrpE
MSRKKREEEAEVEGTEPEPDSDARPPAEGDEGGDPAYVLLDEDDGDLARQLAEWRDRALRATAEMENMRRRTHMEAQNAKRFANEGLLQDLLPVLDNFAAALAAAEKTDNVEALRSGVDLIHRQLADILRRSGLQPIEALGQPFDPNYHEAVMQIPPGEGQDPNTVVEELRRGYSLNDRVLRPTLVKVTSS